MKRASVAWFRISFLVAALVFVGCSSESDGATHFLHAEYRQQTPGYSPDTLPPTNMQSATSAEWTTVPLQHISPRPLIDIPESTWTTHWYRIHYQSSNAPGADLALYIPRVHAGSEQLITFYLNGVQFASPNKSLWNDPLLIPLPPVVVDGKGERSFNIQIAISIRGAAGHALSTFWVAPQSQLESRHALRSILQLSAPQITSVTFLALGVFAFAFWLRRRSEITYLLFGLAGLVNFLRTLHYYIRTLLNDGPMFWWLTVNSLAWLMVLVHLFSFRLHGQRFPRFEYGLIGVVAAMSVGSALLSVFHLDSRAVSPLLYILQALVGFVVVCVTTYAAINTPTRAGTLVAGALWLNQIFGIHDWLLQNWLISIESVYLLPYGSMCLLAAFLYAVLQRFLGAIGHAEALNVSLETTLIQRTQELQATHEKLRRIEREQAIVDERQRLMREMHDGLGSSLMSSLVLVEQGRTDNQAVASVLRESIDDLKLTIDSLEPMEHDLPTLLGTLRYRIGKRLEAAGLTLDWQVQETPPLPWLNPTSALQILRILQEALTNILKHASATIIRVATAVDQKHVHVCIVDNGKGFDVVAELKSHTGRGLHNLQRRTASLGGQIEIRSRVGETSVTLSLPRERRSESR